MKQLKKQSWKDEVVTKRRLLETLRCSLTEVARLINEPKSLTSLHVKLARALEEHPELSECKNIDAARRQLKQIERGATPSGQKAQFDFETDLQRYLYENWETTQLSKEWKLLSSPSGTLGRYPANDVGEIDLLARGRTTGDWLVIELKRDQSSDVTVGQLLRYMGWVKSHLADRDEKVHGLIICATVETPLKDAISCVPYTKVLVYERKKGCVELYSPEQALIATAFARMSQDEKQRLLDELHNMDKSD